ncbi:MAG: hypothetical protein ACK4RK_05870 [Gemmataceae bacterium]
MMRDWPGLPKRSVYRRYSIPCAWLVLCGSFWLVGCHALRILPTSHPVEKLEKKEKTKDAAPLLPSKQSHRVSQYVFYTDFDLNTDQPLFHELAELRDQVYKELRLPPANTVVQVYLFETKDGYEQFMRSQYPDLPKRRAFFVAQPHGRGTAEDLLVYTYWSDRIRQDLRHELTHALLHSVLKDVPMWLDEGLAEFYELPPERQGINAEYLSQLQRGTPEPFQPNLVRLEKVSKVQQMNPAEYRESWAWVHLMLRGEPQARAVLLDYLQQLRFTDKPEPMQPKLAQVFSNPSQALLDHLTQLAPLTDQARNTIESHPSGETIPR